MAYPNPGGAYRAGSSTCGAVSVPETAFAALLLLFVAAGCWLFALMFDPADVVDPGLEVMPAADDPFEDVVAVVLLPLLPPELAAPPLAPPAPPPAP
jgi:hypothetical protein